MFPPRVERWVVMLLLPVCTRLEGKPCTQKDRGCLQLAHTEHQKGNDLQQALRAKGGYLKVLAGSTCRPVVLQGGGNCLKQAVGGGTGCWQEARGSCLQQALWVRGRVPEDAWSRHMQQREGICLKQAMLGRAMAACTKQIQSSRGAVACSKHCGSGEGT